MPGLFLSNICLNVENFSNNFLQIFLLSLVLVGGEAAELEQSGSWFSQLQSNNSDFTETFPPTQLKYLPHLK